MQVIIGNTDVTQYVQQKTYDVNTEKKYITWTDSNYTEHRDAIYEKVVGSFQMVFIDGYEKDGAVVDGFGDFLELLEENTSQGVTTISLTVNNQNAELKTISCFVDIHADPMLYPNNGSNAVVKRVTLSIKEQ